MKSKNKKIYWKKLKSKLIYKNSWLWLREDKVIRPDGKHGIYAYLGKYPGAFIVAKEKDNSIYMIKEYRYPINKVILQLPAGVTGKNNLLKGAKEELFQETGLTAKEWKKLGCFYAAAGHETTKVYVFLATQLNRKNQTTLHQEHDESILKIINIKLPKLKKMIKEDKIECGLSLAALNLFFQKFNAN